MKFIRFQNYLAQLTPEQYVKLDKAAKTRKLEVDLKKEKKKELENLRKPKHPGNAFILFLNTLPNAADKPRRVSPKWSLTLKCGLRLVIEAQYLSLCCFNYASPLV